jgi:hypothetical protein
VIRWDNEYLAVKWWETLLLFTAIAVIILVGTCGERHPGSREPEPQLGDRSRPR